MEITAYTKRGEATPLVCFAGRIIRNPPIVDGVSCYVLLDQFYAEKESGRRPGMYNNHTGDIVAKVNLVGPGLHTIEIVGDDPKAMLVFYEQFRLGNIPIEPKKAYNVNQLKD